MEDDVRFKPNWYKTMISVNANLPKDWDILFIGSCCATYNTQPKNVSTGLYQVNHCLCTHAYAVRAKVIPFLLTAMEEIQSKIDVSLCLKVMPYVKAYAILPRIAHQSNTFLYA
jgi:hypothetical protein